MSEYEKLEIDVILFENADVITNSVDGEVDTDMMS
jgi:hypothetical protein